MHSHCAFSCPDKQPDELIDPGAQLLVVHLHHADAILLYQISQAISSATRQFALQANQPNDLYSN